MQAQLADLQHELDLKSKNLATASSDLRAQNGRLAVSVRRPQQTHHGKDELNVRNMELRTAIHELEQMKLERCDF